MTYSLSEFLAHAIAMEREAAERYLELADMMEAHRNDAAAKIFRDMCRYSELHHDSVCARAGSAALPALRSWDYRWRIPPEVGGEEAFDYMIQPYNALKYARANEVRSMKYYRSVAAQAADPELQRLAEEFAGEEREHVLALDRWLAQTLRPSATFADDPDTVEPV